MAKFRNTKIGQTVEMTRGVAALFNDALIRLCAEVYWPYSAETLFSYIGTWETVETIGGLNEVPVTYLSDDLPDELENGNVHEGRYMVRETLN